MREGARKEVLQMKDNEMESEGERSEGIVVVKVRVRVI